MLAGNWTTKLYLEPRIQIFRLELCVFCTEFPAWHSLFGVECVCDLQEEHLSNIECEDEISLQVIDHSSSSCCSLLVLWFPQLNTARLQPHDFSCYNAKKTAVVLWY